MSPAIRLLTALEALRGGRLHLTLPDGSRQIFGGSESGSESGPDSGLEADLVLRDWAALPLVRALGVAGLGRAHAAGLCETSAIEPLVTLGLLNRDRLAGALRPGPLGRLRDAALRRRPARAAMPGNEFFSHWLDPGMDWSTGLFAAGDDDLGRAQARKHDRILRRLPGDDLLEIGCGWGAFAERAADHGRRVTALAPTGPQRAYAEARLDGRARVLPGGPDGVTGRFAHVVAIEPRVADWPAFLAQAAALLAPGGRMALQAVTLPDAEYALRRRAVLPSPAVLLAAAERAGLRAAVLQGCGPDAARTRRLWAHRLRAAAPRLARHGFDAPFLRHWQFALESAAARFALGLRDVVQLDLVPA